MNKKSKKEIILSIIIPVYNEKATFLKILKKVEDVDLSVLGKIKKEIIIVDDFSTDGTRNILKRLVKKHKYKIILKGKNKGKGHTVKIGLKHATGDINIIQDADLEYEPNDYLDVLKPILKGETKVVYGSRFKGKQSKKDEWAIPSHYLGNKLLTLVTTVLYFRNISDMETCYKCFTREVKEKLLNDMKLNPKRFDLEPEITTKIIRAGYKIKEVSIHYYPRDFSEGKKINWKDGIKALWYLFKYRFVN